MLADLDVYDAINAEIWAKSLRIQAAARERNPETAADLLQAVLGRSRCAAAGAGVGGVLLS